MAKSERTINPLREAVALLGLCAVISGNCPAETKEAGTTGILHRESQKTTASGTLHNDSPDAITTGSRVDDIVTTDADTLTTDTNIVTSVPPPEDSDEPDQIYGYPESITYDGSGIVLEGGIQEEIDPAEKARLIALAASAEDVSSSRSASNLLTTGSPQMRYEPSNTTTSASPPSRQPSEKK